MTTSVNQGKTGELNPGKRTLWQKIWEHKLLYVMLIPMLAYLLVFCYYPMYGVILAFKDFNFSKGIMGSPLAKMHGFNNFMRLFRDPPFFTALKNTIVISFGRLLFEFPVPVGLALLINEIRSTKYKRVVQTVYTFPHFISWIIVSGLFFNLFSNDGVINQILLLCGLGRQSVLTTPSAFRPLIFISSDWKEMGWSAIIYLATISGINPELYEAARIDGAGRGQLAWHITLPCIRGTIAIMLVMQVANMMNAGFDQLFNLSNVAVREVSDIIDTLIYRKAFSDGTNFGYTTAIGLFKSVINFAMLLLANGLVKKSTGKGIY